MQSEKPLSVAEVCEIVPGDDQNTSWVNGGCTGSITKIEERATQRGGKMFICTLRDTTGSAELDFSVFSKPAFEVGDLVDILGKGIRRTEYKGRAQIALSKTAKVHRVGRAVASEPAPRAPAPSRSTTGTRTPGNVPPAQSFETAGEKFNGQTVGMAIKEAIGLCERSAVTSFHNAEFWRQVHVCASDILRVTRLLEHGKLAPSAKARASSAEPAPAPEPEPEPDPSLDRHAAPEPAPHRPTPDPLDEDVPF